MVARPDPGGREPGLAGTHLGAQLLPRERRARPALANRDDGFGGGARARAAGSASASRFTPFSSAAEATFSFEPAGTTTTSRLESSSTRVPAWRSPAFST